MQRTTEWIDSVSQGQVAYHERQYDAPYESTIAFNSLLHKHGLLRPLSRIADMCCGMGAPTAYIAERSPDLQIDGFDIDPILIESGKQRTASIPNLRLFNEDIYHLPEVQYDGIISMHALSWLPNYQEPLQKFSGLNPEWMAFSSLFYDGLVDCKIEVKDYSSPVHPKPCKEAFYNIYALPIFQTFCDSLGFSDFHYERFEIPIDLPQPANSGMGTFTETLQGGTRIQFSGPLLMSWYFVIARKL